MKKYFTILLTGIVLAAGSASAVTICQEKRRAVSGEAVEKTIQRADAVAQSRIKSACRKGSLRITRKESHRRGDGGRILSTYQVKYFGQCEEFVCTVR